MTNPPGLWELAVLSILREGPTHPYDIQRLLKERRKDDFLVLKPGSLYHAIRRLEAADLIHAVETTRGGRRPEKTTYRITAAGERQLTGWLRALIATPLRERSTFMGSVSFLVHLTPAEAIEGLEGRAALLEREVGRLDTLLDEARRRVPRIHLVESEYARAMCAAELAWVRGLVSDLRAGRLTWDLDTILETLRQMAPAAAAVTADTDRPPHRA